MVDALATESDYRNLRHLLYISGIERSSVLGIMAISLKGREDPSQTGWRLANVIRHRLLAEERF